ncbi:Hypothetical protein R9X50_00450000 [Acrodontium crateriforme]|uniref:nicotinamidase n=1 Tax=Acrodontium crateriforme TaxID=150365 RepID=A0AAQ3RAU9_9PEZI|nr:Hypothetical protein R9X50_00450000 [Acrodontium crateriforme]
MWSKVALAVIDFQEDFCPPNGSLAVNDGRSIAPAINHLLSLPFALKVATRDYHPVDHISFATQHPGAQPFVSQHTITSPENKDETQTTTLWPPHCVQRTKGADLIQEFESSKVDLILDKGQDKRVESYSAFGPPFRKPPVAMSGFGTKLKDAGVTKLFVVGLAFDFCVKHTAIDAAREGYETYVIEDATKAVDQSENALAASRAEMEQAGVKIIHLDSDELTMN